MIKRIMSLAMLAIASLTMWAQTPLPLNPEVRHGQLPNGLNYYILHNEEPKERVNFYIAQKVGSTLETPEQLGLAHFLEHMAFNGTTNYPGKNMLNYLQSKGIRFGADINAYTAFDETVYNIDNVPSTDAALCDSVLLVLHDWSGSILLEEDEINAERGVIEEEWRSRNSAMQRMYEAILPIIYQEYQYQQMPIGKMEVVRNFAPETIRAYYKKWYRPDQQGIVIVGDINVDEMEQKVIKLFSDIPMPENAAERTYPTVSDNEEPIYAYFKDKELQYPMIQVMFKSEKLPFEMRNTVEGFMQTAILQNVIATMINNRLSDYQKKPECKYAFASVSFADFLVSKTKDSFDILIVPKDNISEAYSDALAMVMQAIKTGFMDSEYVRARDEMIANYDKLFNERKTTKNETLAREIIRHFIDNEPVPGIETESQLAKQILLNFPVAMINQILPELITKNNQVIVVSQPENDSMEIVTKEQMVNGLNKAIDADYEAYVDEVITDPLIAQLPTPGQITSENAGEFGTTELVLSNGVKVIVKPTDFKSDEVLIYGYKKGGKGSYSTEDANEILLIDDAFQLSQIGPFNASRLEKYLAGKKVSTSYGIGNYYTNFHANSTVKDLPTAMELVYASFTELTPDMDTYNAQMDQAKALLKNQETDANFNFQKHTSAARYNNNPLYKAIDLSVVENANYPKAVEIIRNSMANAADYTFVITGNVDLETLKPLLAQYIATLPSTGTPSEVKVVTDVEPATGQVNDQFQFPMQVPSVMVFNSYLDKNLPWSAENEVKVSIMGDILEDIYTNTLREEEGGTYSPYAGAGMSPFNGTWNLLYVFQTNEGQQEKLQQRAYDEYMKLLNEGATEVQFQKAREAALKQFEIAERTNNWWLSNLMQYNEGFDGITNARAAIENLTLADFNAFMKNLYNGNNRIQVVLHGTEAK